MRGIPCLVCDTSEVDPIRGIKFRGISISDCKKLLPKAKNGEQPLPEGMLWLLLTGDIPTEIQVKGISKGLAKRAILPEYVLSMIQNFPKNAHPLSQLSSVVAIMSTESKFRKNYQKGMYKTEYWEVSVIFVRRNIGKLCSPTCLL